MPPLVLNMYRERVAKEVYKKMQGKGIKIINWVLVRELGEWWHSNWTSVCGHKCLDFILEGQITWVCRRKMCPLIYIYIYIYIYIFIYGGGWVLKLIFPIGPLINLQKLISAFPEAMIAKLTIFSWRHP